MVKTWEHNAEIQIFREYLMIPSISTDEYDYAQCVEFIKNEAAKLFLPVKIYYPVKENKPIVILEWKGKEPGLPKILLNSHMDVAPVTESLWTYPPFAATIDDAGRIIARGSQDMKCCATQYLAAIRALKHENVQLKRTVLIMFVPDEEIGGKFGMSSFVSMHEFKSLNIGFGIDEGLPSPLDNFDVFYVERATWHMRFIISGQSDYGWSIKKDIAGEKTRHLIDKFMDYRATEFKRLETQGSKLTLGDVTTINLTQVYSVKQCSNIIPDKITICIDCRLSLNVNQRVFENEIKGWMREAGGGIELIFDRKDHGVSPTILENNPFWGPFQSAISDLNLTVIPKICPATAAARSLRKVGIPSIGFTALNNTPVLVHSPDEFVLAETYLKGIKIWKKLLVHLANT